MSSTSLTAGQVMDRAAALMNDPIKTDYTYVTMLPYFNMAWDELIENLQESNAPVTDVTSDPIVLEVGQHTIYDNTAGLTPIYPENMIEIQQVSERQAGSQDTFVQMTRVDFKQDHPPGSSFIFWSFENGYIEFNMRGATTRREIQLRFITSLGAPALNENFAVFVPNSMSYLSYRTASLCSMYIGENTTRANALAVDAKDALERLQSINNKGRQEIVTRHRPFRARYKARGGF